MFCRGQILKTGINYTITEVERETGISSDTLRIWERRYGFPSPERDHRSVRIYHEKQLSRLRLLKQLLDRGMRPGKLMKLDDAQLRQLATQATKMAPVTSEVDTLLELVATGQTRLLRPMLESLLGEHGLRSFLSDVVEPMNHAVGAAWSAGRIGILDEHHYAEQLRMILTAALHALPQKRETPRVLLTTLPGEQHGLGLLMAACMLGLEGAAVLMLGVQTPLEEIVRGAVEGECSVVGISCSEYMGRRTIVAQLVRLRRLLPMEITIWVGGSGSAAMRSLPAGIRLFTDLNQIPGATQVVIQQLSGKEARAAHLPTCHRSHPPAG